MLVCTVTVVGVFIDVQRIRAFDSLHRPRPWQASLTPPGHIMYSQAAPLERSSHLHVPESRSHSPPFEHSVRSSCALPSALRPKRTQM